MGVPKTESLDILLQLAQRLALSAPTAEEPLSERQQKINELLCIFHKVTKANIQVADIVDDFKNRVPVDSEAIRKCSAELILQGLLLGLTQNMSSMEILEAMVKHTKTISINEERTEC